MPAPQADTSLLRHLLRSTISNYIGLFVHLGAWFLLTPFILDRLGNNLYGLWVLVGSVVGYTSLLDFGIASAVTKYVAEYRARNDWSKASQLVGTALLLYSGLGPVVISFAALLAPFFADLFNVPPDDRSTAIWLVVLTGINLGLAIPCATTGAILRGFQRFDLINLLEVMRTVLLASGIVVVLQAGFGPVGIVAVNTVVILLIQVPSVWFIRRMAPDLGFSLRGADGAMARRITSFSLSIFMLHVGGKLENQTDEIVIGAAMPLAVIAPYNLARMLSALPQMVAEQFLSLLLPMASEMDAVSPRARISALYVVSTRMTLGVLLPTGLGLMVLGGALLSAWVGEEFGQYGHLVVILTAASVIDTSVWPGGQILQGMARHRLNSIAALASGLCNLGLSILLVRTLGITGVALGTLIPTTIICLGIVMPYSAHVTGTSARAVAFQILVPALMPALPAALVLFSLREVLHPVSLGSIVLTAAAGGGVYAAAYLSSKVCAFERGIIRDLASNAWRRATSRPE